MAQNLTFSALLVKLTLAQGPCSDDHSGNRGKNYQPVWLCCMAPTGEQRGNDTKVIDTTVKEGKFEKRMH